MQCPVYYQMPNRHWASIGHAITDVQYGAIISDGRCANRLRNKPISDQGLAGAKHERIVYHNILENTQSSLRTVNRSTLAAVGTVLSLQMVVHGHRPVHMDRGLGISDMFIKDGNICWKS